MNIAFILINCDMGYEMQTISDLKNLCDSVNGTYGVYDFVCKLEYDDVAFLEKILQKIRNLRNITHTVTIHTIPEQS